MEQLFTREDFLEVCILSIPLIIGGVLHMAVVKTNILSYFKKPIHKSSFGENKTWRGFVVMPLATFPGVLLAQKIEGMADLTTPLVFPHSALALSLALGTAYCLAELPNSFMKRRLGIRPGETSGKYKWFFVIIDQMDSVIGCLLAYMFFMKVRAPVFIGAVILGTGIHLLINNLLYVFGLRKNPL